MKVLFINNDGGGFAAPVEIEEKTTVIQLFQQKLPDRDPTAYMIRVNRLPAAADQILCDGDRVSMTPVKIEGA